MSNLALILPLTAVDASSLPLVGGKATNLGELLQAGFPVPEGFCVTTTAYELASQQAGLEPILDELVIIDAGDTARLAQCAAKARNALLAAAIPAPIVEAIRQAYPEPLAVAVRSSATAEDLPFASFAGQQETYLNVIGIEAVLDAVRRCWASLWTDRATIYRASNAIDARTVRLAVVVQQMVNAAVAGVLFTANPLTGRRQQAVIDANPGLGEAVVSGAVNPDHFVVDATGGEIVERRLGQKQLLIRALAAGGTERIEAEKQGEASSLSDEQVVALAKLGMQVEAHFGVPQDIEWAIDGSGKLWLTQARPITTLFPLPADAPSSKEDVRVYLSVNVAQGVYGPFTPMGISFFRLLLGSAAAFAGFPPANALAGPAFFKEAADRIFLDLTPMLRSTSWRPLLFRLMEHMEARSGVILEELASDPRFSPVHTSRKVIARKVLALLLRSRGVPITGIIQALISPKAMRVRLARLQEQLYGWVSGIPTDASASDRLTALERHVQHFPVFLYSVIPLIGLVFGLPALAGRLLKGLASDDELQVVRRSLPYNPTTEMNLALWQLARNMREETTVITLFREKRPEQLAHAYREGTLPPVLQQALASFLRTYGHRAVAEIDLGLPRWLEDPAYLFGVLASYLQLADTDSAPDIQFERGAEEAEAMVVELTRRARKRSWLRGKLVHFCLRRIRDLTGMREVPKFDIVLLMAGARRLLLSIGKELKEAGRLEAAEDIFFLTLAEVHEVLAGKDMSTRVRERRQNYERELGRRHIPRILLSDGTEPEAEAQTRLEAGATDGMLTGTPASAGVVKGRAHVILDPLDAHLEPGEILIAPSTDPGWTPLFLTASGLVMEMGGPMSHGAVVAREYGIPAVVGVSGAIERIATGQQVIVDGSQGTVMLL